jgi:hypothetical protein
MQPVIDAIIELAEHAGQGSLRVRAPTTPRPSRPRPASCVGADLATAYKIVAKGQRS